MGQAARSQPNSYVLLEYPCGVAVLLTPSAAVTAAAWNLDRRHARAISITVHDVTILPIFAPDERVEFS